MAELQISGPHLFSMLRLRAAVNPPLRAKSGLMHPQQNPIRLSMLTSRLATAMARILKGP
jgi:hypothetical protein